jgi:hypothetical protein
MPLTRWSFFWGGDIPADPTFWGGNTGEIISVDPEDPRTELESKVQFSAIWMGEDRSPPEGDAPQSMIAGDTLGWVPALTGPFQKGGDTSFVVLRSPQATNLQSFNIVRSDQEGSHSVYVDGDELIRQVHAEPYAPIDVTGLVGRNPSFTCLAQEDGTLTLKSWNFVLRDLNAPPFKIDPLWDNELQVLVTFMRAVSLPRKGTVIAVPVSDDIYLKSTFGSGASEPATPILVDLSPGEEWEVDLRRLHVTSTAEGTLLFYYAVYDVAADRTATAVFAYNPFHLTYTDDLPFNEDGVVHMPDIFIWDLVPTISHKGASRHGVSNEILIALERTDIDRVPIGKQLEWATTRGLGIVADTNTDIWNEETHPALYGGVLHEACPDRAIDMLSVNWTGGRQHGSFQILGKLKFNEVAPGYDVVTNTYHLDEMEQQVFVDRMLVGVSQVGALNEANVGGSNTIELVRTAAMHTLESKRQGYNLNNDILQASLVARLDDVGVNNDVELEVGATASANNSVTPTIGMVSTSLLLPQDDSLVTIDGDTAYDGTSVVISMWVYPQLIQRAGDTDQYTIVYREGSGGDAAFRLAWDFTAVYNGKFQWEVKTSTGPLTIDSGTDLLPLNRWYHVTVSYCTDTEKSSMYLFGVLVGEINFQNNSVLDEHPDGAQPIYLGKPPGHPSYTSLYGRVDDFVLSTECADHQQVIASFFDGTVAEDGPVRTSRSNNVELQDHIYSTASAVGIGSDLSVITVAARFCNFHVGSIYSKHVVFDVWKLVRGSTDIAPQYMGVLVPPAAAMDRFNSSALGTLVCTSPDVRSQPFTGSDKAFDFDIKLVNDSSAGGTTEKYRLYMLFKQDEDGGAVAKAAVYNVTFDPNNPIDASKDAAAYRSVVEIPTNYRVTAWTPVRRGTANKDVTVLCVTDIQSPSLSNMWLQEEDRYDGVGDPNIRAMSTILPSSIGSFFNYDYMTDFSTTGRGPTARGMVGRDLRSGDYGWPDGMENDIQVLFGLESSSGGAEIPGTAPQVQTIGTVSFIIQEDAITGAWEAGEFPIYDELESKQLDEYGVGGVDPIVPLGWVKNSHQRTGNTLLLGVSGNRDGDSPGLEGQGGLTVYGMKREGNWGIRPLWDAGPSWGSSQSASIGASIAISDRSDTISGQESPDGWVFVCRPMFDRTDRFSTIHMSGREAEDAEYDIFINDIDTPVFRRNDRNSGLVWEAWSFSTHGWSSRRTGATVKSGSKRRAVLTLRWSHPGKVYDLNIPNQ